MFTVLAIAPSHVVPPMPTVEPTLTASFLPELPSCHSVHANQDGPDQNATLPPPHVMQPDVQTRTSNATTKEDAYASQDSLESTADPPIALPTASPSPSLSPPTSISQSKPSEERLPNS